MEYNMHSNSGFAPENGFEYTTAPPGTTGTPTTISYDSGADLGNNILACTWLFEIDPQPDKEWVIINTGLFNTNPINISYANMYSECVIPEPTTMLLLGSGLVGLIGARRKFKKSALNMIKSVGC